jgi:hypothetical protein
MSLTFQLFEVDVTGIVSPRQVSKLSRHNPRCLDMPPKVSATRRGRGSVAVAPMHPANVAAARTTAATESGDAAVSTRTSPPRGAKSVASTRIAEQMSPLMRVPVALGCTRKGRDYAWCVGCHR